MMIGSLKIGNLYIKGVFRHRFEKEEQLYQNYGMWKKWELGLWFNRYKAVGKKDFKNPNAWSENLVSIYTLGLNLLVVKLWVEVDYGAKHFKIKK